MRIRQNYYKLAVLLVCFTGCSHGAGSPQNGETAGVNEASPGGGGWADTISQVASNIFLGSSSDVLFMGYDELSVPGEPIHLRARVQKGRTLSDAPGVVIGFYRDENLLGTAQTDDEGVATMSWTPEGVGNYDLAARVLQVTGKEFEEKDKQQFLQAEAAPIFVMVREPNTPFVVVDLDHTLVDAPFSKVLVGQPAAMADSVEVLHRIAQKYSVIYLTQRPDILARKSKQWVVQNKYPPGVLLVSTLGQAIRGSGPYKTTRLALLGQTFTRIHIGIGDKISDAEAYAQNGLTAYLIPHYKQENIKDLRKMARELRRLERYPNLQVVNHWQQIEAGIFEGNKYPARAFADILEQKAYGLEMLKRREKENDD